MSQLFVPNAQSSMVIKPERIYIAIVCAPTVLVFVAFNIASIYFSVGWLCLGALPFLLLFLYKFLFLSSFTFYLTDQQLIIQRGLFTRTTDYLELYRIKDIAIEQKIWMRMFGLMSLRLISLNSAEPLLAIDGIKTSSIAQKIRAHVQECRKNNKILSLDK